MNLILGGLVYVAMQQKKEATRNVILVVAGLLFFCMVGKEGFESVTWGATYDGSARTATNEPRAAGDALSGSTVGNVVTTRDPYGGVSGIITGTSSSFKFDEGWTRTTALVGAGAPVLNATCNLTGTGDSIVAWPNEVRVKTTVVDEYSGDLTADTIDSIYECVDTSTAATTCPDTNPGNVSCTAPQVYKPGKAFSAGQEATAANCCGTPDQLCSEGLTALDDVDLKTACPELGAVLRARAGETCDGTCTKADYGYLGACCNDPAGTPKNSEVWPFASSDGLCRDSAATGDSGLACTRVGVFDSGAWTGQNCFNDALTDNCVSKTKGSFP